MVAAACNKTGFVNAVARIAKGDRCVVRYRAHEKAYLASAGFTRLSIASLPKSEKMPLSLMPGPETHRGARGK
jgi:hypothetical protein